MPRQRFTTEETQKMKQEIRELYERFYMKPTNPIQDEIKKREAQGTSHDTEQSV